MPVRHRPGFGVILAWLIFLTSLVGGCVSAPKPELPDLPPLPRQTQLRVGSRYIFHSDVPLPRDLPVLREVAELPERIRRELQFASADSLVHVYLFADRGSYERYLRAHFGHLPPRRAFFMARPSPAGQEEMLVFAFWGERILEDLRHELTHAELHSVCPNIPMWLDEGLAEFFEVPAEQDGVHYQHLAALRSELGSPWNPSLQRMDKLTLLRDMTPQDYREAWAWTHFLLRGPSQARQLLLEYLRDLHRHAQDTDGSEKTTPPPSLTARLYQAIPEPEQALRKHLASLDYRSLRLVSDNP